MGSTDAKNLRLAGQHTRGRSLRIRFTRARLDGVIVPAGKDRVYVFDTECPGLVFMKWASGKGRFYFYRKINGKPQRYVIADGSVAVDDVRKIVRGELTEYAKGNDVRARRLADRKQLTLAELFVAWRKIEGGKKKSVGQYEYLFDQYATPLRNRKINAVVQSDIAKLHADVGGANGPYVANRVLAVLSILFRWAAAHYSIENPVKGVKRFPEYSRERFLQPEELVKFNAAIESEPDPTWKDYWKLLLATGARRDNVAGMRWDAIDLHAKIWRIPAQGTKGKRMLSIPLNADAAAILTARKKLRASEEWIFPSYSLSGRLTSPKKAWERLLERAGLKDLRMHDIRRTVGSYLAMAGVSDRLIGGVLGQTTQQATNVYARLRAEPIREAMTVGAAAMNAARAAAEAEAKDARKKIG